MGFELPLLPTPAVGCDIRSLEVLQDRSSSRVDTVWCREKTLLLFVQHTLFLAVIDCEQAGTQSSLRPPTSRPGCIHL